MRTANTAAKVFISLGGLCTIVVVLLVCVFLVWVVVPLFMPGAMLLQSSVQAPAGTKIAEERVLHLSADEYLHIGWKVTSEGRIISFRLDTGEVLSSKLLIDEARPTAVAFDLNEGRLAFGFADGSFRLGRVRFDTSFVVEQDAPDDLAQLAAGQIASYQDGIVERTPESQLRHQRLVIDLQEPMKTSAGAEIALVDSSTSSVGTVIAALTRDGKLRVAQVVERENLLTGQVTRRLREGVVDVELPDGEIPARLLLGGLGDTVYLAWPDGLVQRYDARDPARPALAEVRDFVEDPAVRLTALAFLNGKSSLVSGDSSGRVRVWFRSKPEDAETNDGIEVVRGHDLPKGRASVVAVAPSPRSRLLAAAYDDASVRLFHVTSEQQLAESAVGEDHAEIRALAVSAKDDAVMALTDDRLSIWAIDAAHPEITWSSIFRPVWYEGHNEPQNVWQSSSGTNEFEEKFGLMPLIFGTIKATFYSMIFGAPLALLAAIYTSQFLHPRTRARVKPTIEIMASLPSVVLGFLAALVIAPLVEDVVPEILALIATIPFAYLLGAHVWQLLPSGVAIKATRFRMLAMIAALPLAILLAWWAGEFVERWLFAGDIKAWLDGQIGTGAGAWMFILLPVSAVLVFWVTNAFIAPPIRRWAGGWTRTNFALLELAKFLVACLATLVLAYALSYLLNEFAWDPRGTFVGTYVQRNSLVVGFIMGFAIIPIIYTISDDALSSVPESLRAASLGAGATQWQTALRVVIPTAMSGLFSALMIGLGRAVGETMIVLMAAGNTPLMDWNIFNGFRTLSANIAVELPEAVINSTHYRMLFLAALSLFIMTFAVNTVAEIVRLRFRRRAFQL